MSRDERLRTYRAEFCEDERYFNFASYGPSSAKALDASRQISLLAATGAAGSLSTIVDQYEGARAAFAKICNFSLENVALVPSTSHALQQMALGLHGEQVVVGAGEFPANLYPWWHADEIGVLRARTLSKSVRMTPDTVASALHADDTVLAVSAVDYGTGYRADLAGLREAIGPDRLLVVDAIQAFGVAAMDWKCADIVISGGQKWVRSGWGIGAIALSERALSRVHDTTSSWAGYAPSPEPGGRGASLPGASRLAVTNLSPTAAAAFRAALDLIAEVGVTTLEESIADAVDQLIARITELNIRILSPTTRSERAGIVVIEVPQPLTSAVRAALDTDGYSYSWHEPNRLRISVHATTLPKAIDDIGECLENVLA
ncbi:aminotransferase class V-fold PLP-dependent enzyme [Salinibacterium sp. TMP30]|uniref:aminotransferase class V-fold PLP-dependent enzyme n=1 Tax=Salinibacterium sp. TMP30 TaxID=3138237 RepID=UPI003138FF5F